MNVKQAAGRFFSVIAKSRTWANVAYVWLAFPLGLLYFIVMVTGSALVVGLSLLWIGLLLGVAMVGVMRTLANFERGLSQFLLGDTLATSAIPQTGSLWKWFRAAAGNSDTWKGSLFLFLKFPLGIASWVASVVLFSASIALIASPFSYERVDIDFGYWTVTEPVGLALAAIAGVLLFFVTLHAHNAMGMLWKAIGRYLLSSSPAEPAKPHHLEPPAVVLPADLQMA